ncbi:MAG TPA: hypothetical protein VH092_11465 [Urbifossiella sp.]|jgi:hypothetical protein|nr:hypothetical protein [Urbifossiella sp.]
MKFVVTVGPHAGGFQARTGGPLDLTAEGPTADDAVAALRGLIAARLRTVEYRSIDVPDPLPKADPTKDDTPDPVFNGYLEAIAEHRRIHNTVPDAD